MIYPMEEMNPAKKRLADELGRLNAEIGRLSKEEREDEDPELTEDIDRAAADAAVLEKESQLEHLEREKESVLNALKRIEEGKYGICEKCGGKIDPARLEILPTARLCMSCKVICDNCGTEIEEAQILGRKIPLICQGCREEIEPESYYTSSSIIP